jgi:DNA-binding FadR family transcriptional regulator
MSYINQENIDKMMPVFKTMEECANKSDWEGFYNCMFDIVSVGMKIINNQVLEEIVNNLWQSKRRIEFATVSRRKETLKEMLEFYLQQQKFYLEGKIDLVEKAIRDFIQKEKEYGIILARELEQNHVERPSAGDKGF